MAVQTQSFSQIVTNAVTTIQGLATKLVNFSSGSVLLAAMQAVAGVALWLQGIALQITALTRFATSNGADADSWGADFSFPRLPPKPASGPVTFSRFTPTAQATIQAATNSGTDSNGNTIWTGGELVQTQDGTQQAMVIPDTTQSAYNSTSNAYIIAAGTASCTATVVNTVAGTGGNVASGALNTLGNAIPGVDTVTNAAPFENGANAESDPAYRARFVSYLASLSKCTPLAIETAVESVQADVTQTLVENQTYAGSTERGYFYIVADDGSGDPPSGFLSTVANAVEATRPIGTQYGVFGPSEVSAAIVLTVVAAEGYTHAAVTPVVQTALQGYTNSLAMGATLELFQIVLQAGAVPGVGNVPLSSVTINGVAADLTVTPQQVIKYSSVVVN